MSKIIGIHSAASRSSTSRSRTFRNLGTGLAACMAALALYPQGAAAQYWRYGPWYGGWGAPAPLYPRAYPPYPRYEDEGPLRPGQIVDIIRRRGWTLLSGLGRSGGHYVANVRDAYGQRMFVVFDAYDGRVLRTRMLDERPDTDSLAAIPGGGGGALPGEGIRPWSPATPGPKPKPKGPVVKRTTPPASVKREPLTPPPGAPAEPPTPAPTPDDKGGGIAVAKPPTEPPGVKPPAPPAPTPEAPSPSAALTPPDVPSPPDAAPAPAKPPAKGGKASDPGSGDPGHPSPSVRQIYPGSGGEGAAPSPTPTPPPAPSPAPSPSASAAPASPPAASPAPAPERAKPAPAKPVLPPDAGFE